MHSTKTIQRVQRGFTLTALLIMVAIMGVLAAFAVSEYSAHVKKAKFLEVVLATKPYKDGAEACFVDNGYSFNGCTPGVLGVPNLPEMYTGRTASIVFSVIDSSHIDIVATAAANRGLSSEVYILHGVGQVEGAQNVIVWKKDLTTSCAMKGIC